MIAARFRCVTGPGASRSFAQAELVREAFRHGVIGPDTLLHDADMDRWYLLGTHEIVRGITPLPPRARPTQQGPTTRRRSTGIPQSPAADAGAAPGATRKRTLRWKPLTVLGFIGGVIALNYAQERRASPGGVQNESSATPPANGGTPSPAEPAPNITLIGLVTNYGTSASPHSGMTGSLSLWLNPFDVAQGDLTIGAPLGGSGKAQVAFWNDSVLFASVSVSGDTIAWIGAVTGGRLVGSYLIFGGSFAAQGGRWWLQAGESALDELRRHQTKPDSAIVANVARAVMPFSRLPLDETPGPP